MSLIKNLVVFVFLLSSCISSTNYSVPKIFAIDNTIIDSLNYKISIHKGSVETKGDYYLINLNSVRGGSTTFIGQPFKEVNGDSYERIQLSNNQGIDIKFSYDKLNKLDFRLGPDSLKIYDISPFFTKK